MLGNITIVEINSTLNRTLKRGGVGPLQEAWQCALTKGYRSTTVEMGWWAVVMRMARIKRNEPHQDEVLALNAGVVCFILPRKWRNV